MVSPIRTSFVAASSSQATAAYAAASPRAASVSPSLSEEDDLAQLDAALMNLSIKYQDAQGSGADSSDERLSRLSELQSGFDSSDGSLSRAGEERCSTGIVLDPRFQNFDESHLQLIRRRFSRRPLTDRSAPSSVKRTLQGQGEYARNQSPNGENSDQASGVSLEVKRVQTMPSIVYLLPSRVAQQEHDS